MNSTASDGGPVLPHDVVDEVLEELIEYVEAVHALGSGRAEGDELLELLLGAQEVVRERRLDCACVPVETSCLSGAA